MRVIVSFIRVIFTNREGKKLRNARVLVLIGILVAGVAGFLAPRISPVPVALVGTPRASDAGTPPIFISGDAGWSTCPWVNGSGTWGDPYVLSALSINGANSTSCILIANTSAVFRIENCNVSNAGSGGNQAGIELNNVTNGILVNNTCNNNAKKGFTWDLRPILPLPELIAREMLGVLGLLDRIGLPSPMAISREIVT